MAVGGPHQAKPTTELAARADKTARLVRNISTISSTVNEYTSPTFSVIQTVSERTPTTAPSCFFTTLCLSFTGPYHRSSYTCSQPATGCTAHLINCTSVQPCSSTTCSSFSSVCLPTSPLFQFARRPTALLVLNPTSQQHKHTSI